VVTESGSAGQRPATTRRSFLRATGATVATAAVLTGLEACGTRAPKPPPAGEPPAAPAALTPDLELLAAALDREHEAIAAYTACIPLLSGAALDAATRFLAQESSHADELAALIKKGGGVAQPPAPGGYELGNPRGVADVLALLHRIERDQIAGYLDAIPRLTPGPIRATVASILANEAQHVAIVRSAAGLRAIPAPLVTSAE
jgi:rubrerythrin